jgi:hypothetical protein
MAQPPPVNPPPINPPPINPPPQVNAPNAAALRLPDFIDGQIQQWLDMVEMEFEAFAAAGGQLTPLQKYLALNRCLPAHVLRKISDVTSRHRAVENPVWADLYAEYLRTLRQRLTDSNTKALQQLLDGAPRGNMMPSEYLRHLRNLTDGRGFNCETVLRQRWISSMPDQVRAILVLNEDDPLERLATIADKVLEQFSVSANVNAVTPLVTTVSASAPVHASGAAESLKRLEKLLADLTLRLDLVEADNAVLRRQNNNRNGRDRSRSRPNTRSNAASRNSSPTRRSDPDVCWYHDKFGQEAQQCRQPCVWKKDTAKTGRGLIANADSRSTTSINLVDFANDVVTAFQLQQQPKTTSGND